MSCWTAKRTDM